MKHNVATKLLFTLLIFIFSVGQLPAHGVLQLPDSDLSWKNVTVNGKKRAVFCIFRDSRDIVWLGTNSGLYFYDGVATHPVGDAGFTGTQVYSIAEKDNRLYVGSNNGLLIYDYQSGLLHESPTPTPKELRVLLAVDGDLWIGGLNGIGRLNTESGELTDYSAGLPHRSVYSLLRDSRGVIYAGTYNGVARLTVRQTRSHPSGSEWNMATATTHCLPTVCLRLLTKRASLSAAKAFFSDILRPTTGGRS